MSPPARDFDALKWFFYNLLFAPVFALMLPGFLLRMLRRGGYRARMMDRFALYPKGIFASSGGAGGFVWIHAVSVGEVQVAGQLMREWRRIERDVRFCFSTTSSTGWKMAEKEVTGRDVLIYNPLDFPTFVKAALAAVNPRAVVLTESEIWPNFIRRAAKMDIPVFLINARVSDRSAPRYRAGRFFFKDVFRCFTRIFAQSELDRTRLLAAGAPVSAIEVTGSFKFDVARRDESKEIELKSWLLSSGFHPAANKVLLGGSTWPGEDEALLKILDGLEGVTLVIAPRHFEKADTVEDNVLKAGYACFRRSTGTRREPDGAAKGTVFLADTTGELMGLYALADAVFVGKSLCARGSQNMIEPCFCGKPTVVGPYTENFRPVMSDLLEQRGICQVAGFGELEKTLAGWFSDGDGGLGARAAKAVAARTGVVSRCVAKISSAIPAATRARARFPFWRAFLGTVFFTAVLAAALLSLHSLVAPDPVGAGQRGDFRSGGVGKDNSRTIPKPGFLRTAAVYAAAIQKPDAKRIFVAGDDGGYAGIFSAIMPGTVETNGLAVSSGGYDIVFSPEDSPEIAAGLPSKVAPGGIFAQVFNAYRLSALEFKRKLEEFPGDDVRLWMFSKTEWMLVGRFGRSKVRMSDMLEFLARDEVFSVEAERSGCGSIQDIAAGYAGRRDEIMPVFSQASANFEVVPQYFLKEEIPQFDWIDIGGVDADIVESVSKAMYDRQCWRRVIVKAEEVSRDKNKLDRSIEMWAEAMRNNPSDTMLLDRLYRMGVNAKVFKNLGKFADAANCYEMMLVIRPDDERVGEEYVKLLDQLGKGALAAEISARLKERKKKRSGGKGSRYDVDDATTH